MKSLVVKRSIVVAEHKTSVSLEDAFWSGLKEIAARRVTTLSELVSEVDNQRQHTPIFRRHFGSSCSISTFKRIALLRPQALLVGADPFFNARREQLVTLIAIR